MKTTYKATGIVYGNYWGGGSGGYQAKKYQADTLKELRKEINAGVKNGTIDSGMGYQDVLGAIMDIETIETITENGKEYKNSSFESEFFGDLTPEQEEFLENCLFNN